MTLGMYVFVFRRIPAWVYDAVAGLLLNLAHFCLWLVPFSWKLARVAGWLFLWFGLLVGPPLLLGRLQTALAPRNGWLMLLAVGWFLLSASGSTWAFLHYRRRRKTECVGAPPPPANGGAATHALLVKD
jgi:hypothetical protein